MASFAGVTVPLDDAECVMLAKEASVFITRNVRSAYSGAADAIRLLHSMGLDLYTASGEVSWELDGYLTGMGIRDQFLTLYGPDLINQAKEGVEYYRRAFVHAGVDPKHTLVVDDSLEALAWAQSVGAKTCFVGAASPRREHADLMVSHLAELPGALAGSR
jgi:HAD superfamily hydrolase (TIGR01509 family)